MSPDVTIPPDRAFPWYYGRIMSVRTGIAHAAVGIALLVGALIPPAACAETVRFVVNAEARGIVKLDYELGSSSMTFTSEGGAGFRVQGGGRVAHPLDAAAIYEYDLDMRFALKGDHVEVVSKKNTSNAAGKEIMGKVQEILPFVYLSRTLPRTAKGYTLTSPEGVHVLSYAGTASEIHTSDMEVSLKREGRELARFYVRPAVRGPGQLSRFLITRRSGANLMFVAR